MLENHRRFIGCNNDVKRVQRPITRLEEVYGSQLLHSRSNLTCEDELKESAHIYLAEGKCEKLAHRWIPSVHHRACHLYRPLEST